VTQAARHTVLGIRHHGPGCARALAAALDALMPDCVLVEGPPEADALLPLLAAETAVPPVAVLVYPLERPGEGIFFPLAAFSPEWVALRWALARGVPVQFMDLPASQRLWRAEDTAPEDTETEDTETEDTPDPIAALSAAAGYDDPELWWERQVEQRRDARALFEGIALAMDAVRAELPDHRPQTLRREAHMRQTLRAALKSGAERVAVVCGAWHAPALTTLGPAKADAELLRGLEKTKTQATVIPWTHGRLAAATGYGAGMRAPGWYAHLWAHGHHETRSAIHWVARAARLLRARDLDAASASVIETVRLAEALAALRELAQPGLPELREAILSVLCAGEAARYALIASELETGEALGTVPPDAPTVPIARDLETQVRRLRLKQTTEQKLLELDLRTDLDRERSRLFTRLQVLRLDWAVPGDGRRSLGTFRETWSLCWRPEFALDLVTASRLGATVEAATEATLRERAALHTAARDLPALSALLRSAVRCELPAATEVVLAGVQACAAQASDVPALAAAVQPLAEVARYGDVRGTRLEHVVPLVRGLLARLFVAFPPACGGVDRDAAEALADSLQSVRGALGLLELTDERVEFGFMLEALATDAAVHALLRGAACRLLLEDYALDLDALAIRARLALSPVNPPLDAAHWVEGFVRGAAASLLHLDAVWHVLDAFLATLAEADFTEVLPLLRRAFSGFEPPARRAMGEKLATLRRAPASGGNTSAGAAPDFDADRAARVLPVLRQLMGV
jgi:hypothetical protein